MSDIECFKEKHLEDAVKLCIGNYAALRHMIPLLPERYEQPEIGFSLLQGIIAGNPGVVCIEQGKLAGYMIGFQRIPYFKGIQQGVYMVLRMYWVIYNFVRKHFTTKAVPAVKLGVLEREISVEELCLIQIG